MFLSLLKEPDRTVTWTIIVAFNNTEMCGL